MAISPTLLIGTEPSEQLLAANARLRSIIRKKCDAKFSVGGSFYSPWSCIYPMLEHMPAHILLEPHTARGGLVTDREYLSLARNFMLEHPLMANTGLAGLNADDWIPILNVREDQVQLFEAGKRLLTRSSTMMCRLYYELVDFVLPLPGERNRGYGSNLARGIILRTLPRDATPYDVAIDLAHELGHQALAVWQSLDPVMTTDPELPVYSEIRRTMRPAIQTFHASVALAFMHYFVASLPDDEEAQQAGLRRGQSYSGTLQSSLALSNASLRKYCEFTPLGEKLLDEMDALTRVPVLS
jgi:hypothetical protein